MNFLDFAFYLHKHSILFSTGWVMKLELDGDSGVAELMDVDAYEQHVKEAV